MKRMKEMKGPGGRTAASRSIPMVFMPFMVPLILGQTQQPPVFRSRTDVVELDVSVLDKNRRPVRGLTRDDFAILEDGQPPDNFNLRGD